LSTLSLPLPRRPDACVYVCVTCSHVTATLLSRSQNDIGDAGYALLGPWLVGATSLTSLNGFEGLAQVRGAYRIILFIYNIKYIICPPGAAPRGAYVVFDVVFVCVRVRSCMRAYVCVHAQHV
jgi:hypothetical protein